jgi:acetyl-CoA carboxylase biotin carboxyl carrier protein
VKALLDGHTVGSPGVGVWRPAVGLGALVRPGDLLGLLEVLGTAHRVVAPPGARGVVTVIADGAHGRARVPVDHGAKLFVLDPAAGAAGAADISAQTTEAADSGLAFRAPTSGRFYSRSSPDKPAFVVAGQILEDGHTVCLLEVMKTFNRVVYDGARARVVEVAVADEADVEAGTVLLRLEPA